MKIVFRDHCTERFGIGKGGIRELAKHSWFESFDWDRLAKRELAAPYPRPVMFGFSNLYYFSYEIVTFNKLVFFVIFVYDRLKIMYNSNSYIFLFKTI